MYIYGWGKNGETKYHIPLPVALDDCWVPEEIMKVCSCNSENSCKSVNCSSNKSRLPCSTFWECEGGISCMNPFNAKARNEGD